jgi:hypothetical protein
MSIMQLEFMPCFNCEPGLLELSVGFSYPFSSWAIRGSGLDGLVPYSGPTPTKQTQNRINCKSQNK